MSNGRWAGGAETEKLWLLCHQRIEQHLVLIRILILVAKVGVGAPGHSLIALIVIVEVEVHWFKIGVFVGGHIVIAEPRIVVRG